MPLRRFISERVKSKKIFYITLLLLILGTVFNHLLFTLATLALAGYFVSLYIKRDFFLSTLSGTILGVLINILFICIIAIILWIIGLAIPLIIIFDISVIVALLFALYFGNRETIQPKQFIDTPDLIAISIIVIYLTTLMVGVVRTTNLSTDIKSNITQSISFGVDDLSHLAMFKDTVEANKGLLLGSGDTKLVAKPDNVSYPKMSHLIAATVANQKHATTDSYGIILIYSLLKNMFFFIGIYAFCRVSVEFAVKRKQKTVQILGAFLPMLGAVTFLLIHPFIQEGFFSVWPVLVFTPLFLLILKKGIPHKNYPLLFMLGSIATIVTMSWPIMGLPLYVVLAIAYLDELLKRGVSKHLLVETVFLAIISILGLVQIFVQLFDKTAPIDSSQLNAPGGIVGFPMLYLLLFSVLAIIAIVSHFDRDDKIEITPFIMYAAVVSGVTTVIGTMNISSSGHLQYFYIKSTILLLIFLALFIVPYVANLLIKKLPSSDGLSGKCIVFAGSLVLCIGVFFSLNGERNNIQYTIDYLIKGQRHISKDAVDLYLSKDKLQGDGATLDIINVDSKIETYYISTLSRSLHKFNYCEGALYSHVATPEDPQNLSLETCVSRKNHPRVDIFILDNKKIPNEISCQNIDHLINKLTSLGITAKASSCKDS